MKKLIFIITILTFSLTCFAQISGDFSNTAINMSKLPPDKWMTLVYNESGSTIGIAAKDAQNGIVEIDHYNNVITAGAGIYVGNEEHKWSSASVIFVTYDGNIYEDMEISGTCTNLYYEGTVLNKKIEFEKSDEKTNTYYVAKPILGNFEIFTDNVETLDVLTELEKDFSDGYLKSEEYGLIEVFIVSSIQQVALIFVIEKQSVTNNIIGKIRESYFSFILTPIGAIAVITGIILIILGATILRSRKKAKKNE